MIKNIFENQNRETEIIHLHKFGQSNQSCTFLRLFAWTFIMWNTGV